MTWETRARVFLAALAVAAVGAVSLAAGADDSEDAPEAAPAPACNPSADPEDCPATPAPEPAPAPVPASSTTTTTRPYSCPALPEGEKPTVAVEASADATEMLGDNLVDYEFGEWHGSDRTTYRVVQVAYSLSHCSTSPFYLKLRWLDHSLAAYHGDVRLQTTRVYPSNRYAVAELRIYDNDDHRQHQDDRTETISGSTAACTEFFEIVPDPARASDNARNYAHVGDATIAVVENLPECSGRYR